MSDCGCDPDYMPKGETEQGLRRINGTPSVGDWHTAQDKDGYHLWDGDRWVVGRIEMEPDD